MLGGHPVFDQPRKYSWSLARYIQSSLVSATFHIRRKIKGWAREGEGKFRAVERRRQFKIFVQNSPTGRNHRVKYFCYSFQSLFGRRWVRKSSTITNRFVATNFSPNRSKRLFSKPITIAKISSSRFHFPSSRDKFRCRPPARKRRTGQGKSDSPLPY